MKIDVLYQFNEKYAPYAGTSITSLFENNRHFVEIRVFILGENLLPDSVKRLEETGKRYNRQIVFVDTKLLIQKMQAAQMPSYRGSYAANMRLFLSDLLDDSVERLLYLDADTIVAGKLDALVSMPMNGYPAAMVQDSLVRLHKLRIGFSKEEFYFNSGVILFDMDRWREKRCSERIAEHVRAVRAHYPSPDQDLLNVVCRGQIMALPPEYNFQPIHLAFSIKSYFRCFGRKGYYGLEELKRGKENPVIYHFFRFVGEFPWNRGNLHPDNDIFDEYLRKSSFHDYVKEPSEAGIILRVEKVLYRILPRGLFIYMFRVAYEWFIYRANKDSLKKKINKMM
ncbi:glycosyltransferase family 8 protein [bacterium C-53]|nr:glycosyltransferase family 8 protein [Lachnospiraceae bacterium]NBI01555.1 glycosyltransferase family 8 protein [Lachnospiraceae bacterium]RKJ12860.1 glycosyltransferase family 8 protein [bacterium C-53]